MLYTKPQQVATVGLLLRSVCKQQAEWTGRCKTIPMQACMEMHVPADWTANLLGRRIACLAIHALVCISQPPSATQEGERFACSNGNCLIAHCTSVCMSTECRFSPAGACIFTTAEF